MKQSKDIEKLVKKFDVDTNSEVNETVLAELLQAQAKNLKDRKIARQRNAGRELFMVRFPRLAWVCTMAAVFVALFFCSACLVLARKVDDLEHQLELAHRDIVAARTEGKLEEARNAQQRTVSTLYQRVEELEERIPRIPSARRVCYPEEYYYSRNRRDSL